MITKYKYSPPQLILAGGQTGVDRAALDWAITMNITHGGWCPRGRTAQDGPLPERYKLRETEATGYSQRTRMNVRDGDATLIIHLSPLAGETQLTLRFANEMNKPVRMVDLSKDWLSQSIQVQTWWTGLGLKSLNMAGPSEDRVPGIYALTMEFLQQLWPC
ncbi:MAG: putative molybdenum carrier protein [Rhodoferax sp.]